MREITDAMIRRALFYGGWEHTPDTFRCMKRALESAAPDFIPEIDEAMVDRAWKRAQGLMAHDKRNMWDVLRAALHPAPAEPEIVVTDEMRKAGTKVFLQYRHFPDSSSDFNRHGDIAELIYAAMRKLEPDKMAFISEDD